MSKFISGLAHMLDAMLDYREALGFSRASHMSSLTNFDGFCAQRYPGMATVTKEAAISWIHRELEKPRPNINGKATALRLLGKYIAATGHKAYILPDDYVSLKTVPNTYLFSDSELAGLFHAADGLPQSETNDAVIAPVIFRLTYTCGLRPNESRELKCENVNLCNGEVFVTGTKRKKERLVVMSDDMLVLCNKYDKRRNAFTGSSPFFFPAEDGDAYKALRLDRLIKRCWESANPGTSPEKLPSVNTYCLRHRFASAILNRWLDEGLDLYAMLPYLRAYMGHTHMSETAYYIHILPENLVKSAGIDWDALESLVPEVGS